MKRVRNVSLVSRGAIAAIVALAAWPASAQRYIQHNLVSDQPGVAAFTDPNLVNAWGIDSSGSGPIWIANNHTGTSTVYRGNGTALPLVVSIPAGAANTEGAAPTGLVFNGTGDFTITEGSASGPAIFLFAGEDGTISGWNPTVDATHAVLPPSADLSATGAIYKGIALGSTASGNFIYATDFHQGFVQVFDSTFTPTTTFTDPSVPLGFAPFGIANIGGNLYVSFAMQDENAEDDVPGLGNGYIDEFDTDGNLIRQFAAQGTLDSPWGMTLAPGNFGTFSGALLVGNFGDGRINAFDPDTGAFLGQMMGPNGKKPISIDGLWGLHFGNGGSGGRKNLLYFTAGPDHEDHGLFGSLRAIPAVASVHR